MFSANKLANPSTLADRILEVRSYFCEKCIEQGVHPRPKIASRRVGIYSPGELSMWKVLGLCIHNAIAFVATGKLEVVVNYIQLDSSETSRCQS